MAEVSDRPIRVNDALALDAAGRTLMPGLIDAHAHPTITTMNIQETMRKPVTLVMHEARVILEGMLSRGFTTIRDAAGGDYGLAAAVDRGLIRGPRIFYCGRALSQTGGHGDQRLLEDDPRLCACSIESDRMSHVADGVDGVRKAAREELRKGAHAIKVMASGGVASPTDPVHNTQYSREEIRAIVQEAASWHTYVLAHAYTSEAVARAVEEGVRTIEHGNLVDRPTAELMARMGAYAVPTLVTYEMMERFGRDYGFPEVSMAKIGDVRDDGLRSLEIFKEAGVPMGLGTDLLGELHHHQSQEFLIRSQVLPPMEVHPERHRHQRIDPDAGGRPGRGRPRRHGRPAGGRRRPHGGPGPPPRPGRAPLRHHEGGGLFRESARNVEDREGVHQEGAR